MPGGPPPAADPGQPGAEWLWWLALGLLAAVRFWGLGAHGLWLDEALTLSDALHQPGHSNPFGYRLSAWLFAQLPTRPDETWLRLPSALAGALSLFLCVFAFRPWAGTKAAFLSAIFLGVSPWHLYWSQTARFYTLAQCAVLFGTALILRALGGGLGRGAAGRTVQAVQGALEGASSPLVAARGSDRRNPWAVLLALGFVALGAGFHPTAMVVLPGLFLSALWLSGPNGQRLPSSARLLLLAAALLGLALGTSWVIGRVAQWQSVKGQGSPAHFILTSGFYFGPLLLSAAILGAWTWWSRRSSAGGLALTVVVISLASGLLLSCFSRMTAQYVFVVLPFVCLLAASTWAPADPRRPGPHPSPISAIAALLVVLPGLVQCGLFLTQRNGERPHWREAYTLVAREIGPYDLLMGMAAPVGEYYLDPLATRLRDPKSVVYLDSFRSPVPRHWDRTGRRTWFVVNFEELADWRPSEAEQFRRTLAEDCRLVASWPLEVESRDLSVYLFVRDG